MSKGAVIVPDGNIQEGQIRINRQGLLVFFDCLAVILDRFKIIPINPMDIHHLRAKLKCGLDISARPASISARR